MLLGVGRKKTICMPKLKPRAILTIYLEKKKNQSYVSQIFPEDTYYGRAGSSLKYDNSIKMPQQ